MAKKKTAKKKTAARKTATKKAPAGKRGTRYSTAMKQKVVEFVNTVNAEKGRGGAAAASRKFGVGQLTIGKWLKGSGSSPAPKKRAGRPKTAGTKPAGASAFRKLADMDEQISTKRAELAALEAQFTQLKKKLLK